MLQQSKRWETASNAALITSPTLLGASQQMPPSSLPVALKGTNCGVKTPNLPQTKSDHWQMCILQTDELRGHVQHHHASSRVHRILRIHFRQRVERGIATTLSGSLPSRDRSYSRCGDQTSRCNPSPTWLKIDIIVLPAFSPSFHSLKVVKEAPGIVALHWDPIQLDCLQHLLLKNVNEWRRRREFSWLR